MVWFSLTKSAVVVNVVTDVLDFKKWLQPVIDPKLSLYSRNGEGNFSPGMHVLRLPESHHPCLPDFFYSFMVIFFFTSYQHLNSKWSIMLPITHVPARFFRSRGVFT